MAGAIPAPPPPPAPPEPPSITESGAFRSLLSVVASNPDVVARLGSPVVLASEDVHGRIDYDADADGGADVRIDLAGPKGRATARVEATLDEGKWSMDEVEFVDAKR